MAVGLEVEDLFDQGDDGGAEGFVVEAVLSFKALGVGVVLLEQIVAVYGGVVVAEEAVSVLAVKIGDALELLTLHHVEVLDDLTRNLEGLGTVLASVLEGVGGVGLHDLGHGGHVERRVYADLFVAEHLLGVHGSHGCAHYYIGLLLIDVLA